MSFNEKKKTGNVNYQFMEIYKSINYSITLILTGAEYNEIKSLFTIFSN